MTTTISRLIIAFSIALAALMLVGFISVVGMFTDEYWCEDRVPWWGPPIDPTSDCSGHSWAAKHPGEYPWTLPR